MVCENEKISFGWVSLNSSVSWGFIRVCSKRMVQVFEMDINKLSNLLVGLNINKIFRFVLLN